jgi:glycosyltransferase involved in cell wall biosynthesis
METARRPYQPPAIPPVTGGERPLWSVMIPAYNCAAFLPETLQSVLKQALSPDQMQIEVVDDASTDVDVKALVEQIGKGRIQYYRQPQNVGSLKNFETCINRAQGHLVHLLHGDDKVRNGYYGKMEKLFNQHPEAGAAFCRYAYINEKNTFLHYPGIEAKEDGILNNWLVRIATRQRIQYCAITVKREVYETLGGFYGVPYGEDWEMWVRLAAHYPVAYTPEVLAEYRRHAVSISGKAFLNGQNMRDLRWVISTIQQYLPEGEREGAKREAYRFYAHYALRTANSLWMATRRWHGARAQVREALRMHRDWKLFVKIVKLYTKMTLNIV